MTQPTTLCIHLPEWLQTRLCQGASVTNDAQAQMAWVIELAEANLSHRSGGPFAAAVFDEHGQMVAAGVNLVTSANCSILHAEMVALAFAQYRLGRHDLSDGGRESLRLVSLAAPCAMCLGAIPWAGISHLVCGARDEDVREIGFDEGCKPDPWSAALTPRGITLECDVLRDRARRVLQAYREQGGPIY